MSIKFECNDIVKLDVDCIVNAANESLLGGGGVDGAIHKAAGSKLLEECRGLNGCKTGEAKITKGYNLKANNIIHTVGPVYIDGKHGEVELLQNCYMNSLQLALQNDIKTIAFPLISAGVYGYPKKDAINIAVDTIKNFLDKNNDLLDVKLIFYDEHTYEIAKSLFENYC